MINSPQTPVVLGATWLSKHKPQIDWRRKEILGWSEECLSTCLFEVVLPSIPIKQIVETYPDLSMVPKVYHDLKEVFNKARATLLTPQRPYDCAIDLIPGSTPPKGALY